MLNRTHATNVLLKLIAGAGLSAALLLIFILPTQATEIEPDRHDWAMPQPPATSTDLSSSCSGGVGNPNDLITAINDANNDAATDTITLAAGCVYTLTSVYEANPDGNGPVGLPPISTTITFQGNGSTIIRDSSAASFRIFYVETGGDLTLDTVTVTGGRANNGGGILIYGTLTMLTTTLTANESTTEDINVGGGGGLMLNGGQASIRNSTLIENQAYRGGAIYMTGGGG